MQIICPNCDTSYALPPGKIGPAGREVRCARCGTRWHAKPVEETRRFDASPVPAPPAPSAAAPPASPATVNRPPLAPVQAAAAAFDEEPDDAPADPTGLASGEAQDLFANPSKEGVDLGWDDPQDRAAPAEPAPATGAADPFEAAESEPAPERDDFVAALDETPSPAPPARSGDAAPDPVAPDAPRARTAAAAAGKAAGPDVESLARRTQARARTKKKTRGLPDFSKVDLRAAWAKSKAYVGLGLLVLALAVPVVGILMRHAIVAAAPAMAGLYRSIGLEVNLRGLVFEKIETLRELDAGQPVLVVEGMVTNVTGESRMVPTLRLALRGDDRQEIYAWSVDPKAQSLAPGASLRFRTKLASPPDEAREVYLRFTERRSRQAVLP